MTVGVAFEIVGTGLERTAGELAAVGIFQDERPLRGGAGRVDWRLCGYLSELLVLGHFSAELSATALLPTFGRLATPHVLVVGLGSLADHSVDRVRQATATVMKCALDLRVDQLVLAPPGVGNDDFPRHAEAVARATADAIEGASRLRPISVALCTEDTTASFRALREALDATGNPELRALQQAVAQTAPAPQGRAPVI